MGVPDFQRALIYGGGLDGHPPTVDWGSFARIVARMSPQRPLQPASRKKQKEKRKEGRGRRRKKKKEDRTKKKGEEEEERKEERIYITTPDQPPHGGH